DLIVVIDPGHGGRDPGAIGRKGTKEKDLTLKIAKNLRDLIRKRLGAKVLLTRSKDVFLNLKRRAEFANNKKADLFISIHANSHTQKWIRGLELYHFGKASDPRALEVAARENGIPLDDKAPPWQFILADKLNDQKIDQSMNFAYATREALVQTLRRDYTVKDHGVKTAPFYVLRYTTMPSLLAEVAFLSNSTDENRLRSSSFRHRLAEGIFHGIQTYFKNHPPLLP
ncbi:MAG: N-acetylmuramoyl-L-alanine amidase, partial [Nitrospirales bacterium]